MCPPTKCCCCGLATGLLVNCVVLLGLALLGVIIGFYSVGVVNTSCEPLETDANYKARYDAGLVVSQHLRLR